MKEFLKEALSGETGASSKRMIGFISFCCAFFVFICAMTYFLWHGADKPSSDYIGFIEHTFDGFLVFSAACLSLTIPNIFSPKQNP